MPFIKDAWGSSQYERNLQMGFNIGGPSLVDIRLVLTKDMMENVDDSVMPPKYFALCNDNNQIYYYDKSLNKVIGDATEVAIGKFRRANILLSDIQDQYGNSLLNDNHIAKVFVAKKLSELINDSDSEGHIIVTDSNFKNYLDKFSTSEEGIFSHVAKTGSYNDLLDLPFIPDDAIYVDYNDPNGIFDELNGGTGNQDITVKQALDAISKAFKEDDVLPLYVETGTGDIGDTAHNVRIRADKREQSDKPEVVIKLNLKDLYNDADYITKAYVDSENHRQDVEIAKKQNKLLPEQNSRIILSDSEDVTYVNTYFEPIAYSGSYADLQNKPVIHTNTAFFQLDDGIHELNNWLQDVNIEDYSPEYVRLKDEVDSEGGVYNRLAHVQNIDLPSKQDKLIAGNNITVNGAIISAKDTLYTAGHNVILANDSAGEPTIINASDSRYLAGDNITITSNGSDSEGKLYKVDAKDTTYKQGSGIKIDSIGTDEYRVNVKYDGISITADTNGVLHATTASQVNVDVPIIRALISNSEGVIKLDYDKQTLVYDTANKLRVNLDNKTLKYNQSDKFIYADLDNKTLVYDGGVGGSNKIKSTLSPLDNSILINDSNKIGVKLNSSTDTGVGRLFLSNDGLYVPIDGSSIYKDNSGTLKARGQVTIKSGTGITSTPVPNEAAYTLDVNIDRKTIKTTTSNPATLVGGYTGINGITIDADAKVGHSNNLNNEGTIGGNTGETDAKGIINVPKIGYDKQGHIKTPGTYSIYPPLSIGSNGQYFSSNGTKNGWKSFETSPTSGSINGISSGAVYTALQAKQNNLIQGSYIKIDNNNISTTLHSNQNSSISITADGAIDVEVDNVTMRKNDTGALVAVSNLPIVKKVTIAPGAWSKLSDSTDRTYYRVIISNFSGTNAGTVDAAVNGKNRVPFITLDETANTDTAIKKYIEWSKVYHVDLIKEGGVYKLEFFSYEQPTITFNLLCTLFATEGVQ